VNEIPRDDDLVNLVLIEIDQHRLKRPGVAMDVGQYRCMRRCPRGHAWHNE
jgi:hypothetical protein